MKLPFDFANKFLLRLVLPGALLSALFWPILLTIRHTLDLAAPDAVLAPVAIILFGWLMLFLDMPIYTLAQGRRFWPARLKRWGIKREKARLDALMSSRNAAPPEDRGEYDLQIRQFALDASGEPVAVLPTRLGNLLRASESYPDRKYGIDGVFGWYRLWIAIDKELRGELDDQQALVVRLESEITRQRALLATAKPEAIPGIMKTVDALAAQASTLKTSKLLSISLPAQTLDLTHQAGRVMWRPASFNSVLIDPNATEDANSLVLGYCLETDDNLGVCDAQRIATDSTKIAPRHRAEGNVVKPVPSPPCPGDEACAKTIVLRPPASVTVVLVSTGQGYGSNAGKVAKALKAPIAQWGEPTYLSLDVGLAQSRTVGLKLDEFGRTNSLSWKSDARLDSIATGAQGVVDAAAAYKKTADGQEAAERNAASADLESRQKYNKLRACEEIINSGGFKCPDS
jgi:hypothetical protein